MYPGSTWLDTSADPRVVFFKDENPEIGIADYDTYATEPAYRHSPMTEYQYVLSGWTPVSGRCPVVR